MVEIENIILSHQREETESVEETECNCHKIRDPLLGQIIRIIETSRYELLEFYRKIFERNKYDEFIFSWILLFGNDEFVQIYWQEKKKETSCLWRYYSHSTHLIYGLELICFKMRNRLPIREFYNVIHWIEKYVHHNQDIMYIFKNYHRLTRKTLLPMTYFHEIEKNYRNWILGNPSFSFLYIEKYQEDEL